MGAPLRILLTPDVIDFMKTWDCVNNEWFKYAHFIRRTRPDDGPPVFEIVNVEDTPQYVKKLLGMIPQTIAKIPLMLPDNKSEILDLLKKWRESDTQMMFVDAEPTISDLLNNPLVEKIVFDIATKALDAQGEEHLQMRDFQTFYAEYKMESFPRQEKVNSFLRETLDGIKQDGKAYWCDAGRCGCMGCVNKSINNIAAWKQQFLGEPYMTKEEVEHYNSLI